MGYRKYVNRRIVDGVNHFGSNLSSQQHSYLARQVLRRRSSVRPAGDAPQWRTGKAFLALPSRGYRVSASFPPLYASSTSSTTSTSHLTYRSCSWRGRHRTCLASTVGKRTVASDLGALLATYIRKTRKGILDKTSNVSAGRKEESLGCIPLSKEWRDGQMLYAEMLLRILDVTVASNLSRDGASVQLHTQVLGFTHSPEPGPRLGSFRWHPRLHIKIH